MGSEGQGAIVLREAARWGALAAMALVLANCSSPRVAGRSDGNKYGVKPSPRVIPEGQPIPKGGGRDMIGKPYVVGGRTYVPTQGHGYSRVGEASWYGTAFHGRLTANGEVFDKESVAAAHPTLPLPSYVRVTNLGNRRSMVVRVNDRGPYEKSRIIDLSEKAADTLGFHRRGTTHVRVEYLGKASLKGSDDRRLLATLRTDGMPAPFRGAVPPVAMAEARGAPAPVRPLAYRPVSPVDEERVVTVATAHEAAPARRPTRLADAAEPAPPVRATAVSEPRVEHLPPARPTLAGIY